MTTYQSMMLSVCFGATVGYLISGVFLSIKFWIEDRHEKKRLAKKDKEAEAKKDSDN